MSHGNVSKHLEDKARCTLCLACSARSDGVATLSLTAVPRLRTIELNLHVFQRPDRLQNEVYQIQNDYINYIILIYPDLDLVDMV